MSQVVIRFGYFITKKTKKTKGGKTMKLTNEIKSKVENLLNKTGLDIELIENESNWEGVYYYQLKVHPVSVYVNVTGAVRFTEKFWYDLNKIIKGAGFHVYGNEKKNAFVVTERESLNVGTYKGGMEYWDGTTDGEKTCTKLFNGAYRSPPFSTS